MSYTYFAVAIEENDKYYAYLVKCAESDNVCSKLKIKGLTHTNVFKTKKKAAEAVTAWNEQYKANGSYLFDKPAF